MDAYVAEFLGTALLVLLGQGVVCNVVLDDSKGHNSGWLVICTGWGFAVFVAVFCVQDISGAHLNPAVTAGLVMAGQFKSAFVPGYVLAQMAGAMTGSAICFLCYRDHYACTKDPDAKLATFATAPAIRNLPINLVCEAVATAVLVFAVLMASSPTWEWLPSRAVNLPEAKVGLGALGALPVGLVVFSIGLSLGGPTGYAINPARDLGPRLTHQLLPISGKRDGDWGYAWVPVIGPILGAVLAVLAAWLLSG